MGFFITESSPVIWRGPMVHGLIRQFLTDVEWGELDYLVIDLPPGTGDAALTLTQQAPLSGAVIVTTPNDLSTVDARKAIRMFEKVNVPVLGVIENMAWFTPPELPDAATTSSARGGGARMAKELGVDFLGEIPIDPRVAEGRRRRSAHRPLRAGLRRSRPPSASSPAIWPAASRSSPPALPPSPTRTSPG